MKALLLATFFVLFFHLNQLQACSCKYVSGFLNTMVTTSNIYKVQIMSNEGRYIKVKLLKKFRGRSEEGSTVYIYKGSIGPGCSTSMGHFIVNSVWYVNVSYGNDEKLHLIYCGTNAVGVRANLIDAGEDNELLGDKVWTTEKINVANFERHIIEMLKTKQKYPCHDVVSSDKSKVLTEAEKAKFKQAVQDGNTLSIVDDITEDNNYAAVKVLLEDSNFIQSEAGKKLLNNAISNSQIDIVKLILENGFDPAPESYRLFRKSIRKPAIFKYLHQKGCDITTTKTNGNIPLFVEAANSGCIEVIQYMLDQGIDKNGPKTTAGLTALDYAMSFNKINPEEVFDLLGEKLEVLDKEYWFQLGNEVALGVTKFSDLERIGSEINSDETKLRSRYDETNISGEIKTGRVTNTFVSLHFPKNWKEKYHFDIESSYNETLKAFEDLNFKIEVTTAPHVVKFSRRKTLKAVVTATSPSGKTKVKINFAAGNREKSKTEGFSVDSPKVISYISITCTAEGGDPVTLEN
ncbi:ankyrin repeat domain-containing protein [Flammeovirga aprica]|uniref:Ankyrin repeat domain-containing protein n=1 Tax=Flammeovirga aprica JL-4 TaxID=694437 RepID=A0A7X9RST8_9BACT|nr:ankyrin repeat domain-containing protein [Flammeovirga aprica]NME67650.1 ankyrin repeat domain-containing protein [Flammeovirga aprica JL-4]